MQRCIEKREIRKKADSFRTNCKIGKYGIIDLFKECERCGYKLFRYPLGENEDLGFAQKRDQDIIIFTNTCSRLSREIFTLAHEIGHVILHLNEGDSFVDDYNTITEKNIDEKEQEANYFAACLLMPSDELVKFIDLELQDFENTGLSAMDIARIMSEFNVSFDMALNRLENLHIIDTKHKLLLDNQKVEKKVGNLLHSVGGNAKLNIPSKVIDMPYEYIEYAIYNYNNNAIPKETLERLLSYYQLYMEDISDKLISHTEPIDDDLDVLIGEIDD